MSLKNYFILPLLLLFIVPGCSLKQQIKGKYYMDAGKYKQGIGAFEEEVHKKPGDPSTNYYLGRFHLAEKDFKKGLYYLKRAVHYSPNKADYHFWLGVAYSANNRKDLERQSYLNALKIDNKHKKALTFLGHNQLEKSEYENALKTYNQALELGSSDTSILYNRALILRHFKRTPEERFAWKQYLAVCATGANARKAVMNLNAIGDFQYRNHLIGDRTVTLKKINFKPSTGEILKSSQPSLNVLGDILKNNKNIALHIVVYQKNNKKLGELRAKSVKKFLLNNYPEIKQSRLRVSWFGDSEKIKSGKKTFRENESINLITAVRDNKILKPVSAKK